MTRTDLISMQRGMIKAHEEQMEIVKSHLAEVKYQIQELEPIGAHLETLRKTKTAHEENIVRLKALVNTTEINNLRIKQQIEMDN